jgi:hypothetical protein
MNTKMFGALCAGVLLFAACGGDDAKTTATTKAPAAADDAVDDHSDDAMDHSDDAMDHDDEAIDETGLKMLKNGHHEEMELTELNAADQAELDRQLAITREVAAQYPTLGVAIDAGFTRAGPFSPGLGIHYSNPTSYSKGGLNPDGVIDDEDLHNPLMFIYDGTDRDAKIAGFMFYSVAAEEPEGFVGPNDFWHYHTNVCNQPAEDGINAPLGADQEATTKEACDAVGGALMTETQWMTHVWSVPGYEMTDEEGGVFGEVNPAIKCADGTYLMMSEKDFNDHPKNFCKSELENPTA